MDKLGKANRKNAQNVEESNKINKIGVEAMGAGYFENLLIISGL